jgi:tetratricopeptide (TPR) repeat protein
MGHVAGSGVADWFRDPSWDEVTQAEFERRLQRARPSNRPQYLRIKGLAVAAGGRTDDAEQIYQRVLDEYPESLDAASAREHLGDLARLQGRLSQAEEHYRTLLAAHPTLNATTGLAELSLAEVLIEAGDGDSQGEAGALLTAVSERPSGLLFNDSRFRWLVARSFLAAVLDDLAVQQEMARQALELLGAGPTFARHPTVGVAHANVVTVGWLTAASSGPLPTGWADIPPWAAQR